MGNTFGQKKTVREQLRENKRMINRAIRELDRERANMEKQEKKLIIDIKKAAKDNQMGAVKIMAKDLVRTRNYKTKFYGMRSQLQAVSLRLETAKSAEAMSAALAGTTKALKTMSKQYNLPKMQKIMMEFEKESERSELQNEMIADVMDDIMTEEGDEEEEEAIIGQVLDEIGINFNELIPDAPGATAAGEAAKQQPAAAMAAPAAAAASGGGMGGQSSTADSSSSPPQVPSDPTLSELEQRLNNLRRE